MVAVILRGRLLDWGLSQSQKETQLFSQKPARRRRLVHHLTMSQTNTLLATTRTSKLTIGDNTTSFRHS
jgi:hypothetical protein